jgi:lambda family phage portal protein
MLARLTRATKSAAVAFRRSFDTAGFAGNASGFDAAGHGDRWPRSSLIWSPVSQSLAAAGPVARRADWLANNSPTAASFVEAWVNNLVSTGPTVRAGHPDEAVRRMLEAAWSRWSARCDAEGNGDLAGYLTKLVRNLVITGDSFSHLVIVDRRLRLKLLNTEQVWRPLTRVLPDGRRIFSGVEVDQGGRRVGYWTLPFQMDLPWAIFPLPERISADDLLHAFLPQFPGAVRGISWLTPIAARLLELDRGEDAMLARINVAALFAGFIRDIDGNSGFAADAHPGRDGKAPELSMEPGSLRILPPGCDIIFPSNIPDTAGATDFIKHLLRSVAAGGGVPASILTGDLSDVNYSSARMGLESFRRAVARLQQSLLVAQVLQPVWERFITVEILSGRLAARDFEDNPEAYYDVDFRWPGWASLDPVKDANADDIALANRTKSRAEVIATRGRDIEDVDREIAADPYKPDPAAPKPAREPITTGDQNA